MDTYVLVIPRSDQKELNHFNYFEKNDKKLKSKNGNFQEQKNSDFNAFFFISITCHFF